MSQRASDRCRDAAAVDAQRMCVNMSYMKTATVREVQHNLKKVLAWVEGGEVVQVVRRAKVVARLVPADPEPVVSPDFVGRARRIWGDQPDGALLSEIVSEARGAR